MNQSQLIDIIGNRDVVTLIQDYMCGTPIRKDKKKSRVFIYSDSDSETDEYTLDEIDKMKSRVFIYSDSDSDSDSETDEDTLDEIDEKESRGFEINGCSFEISQNVDPMERKILGTLNRRDKMISRVLKVKKRSIEISHNINSRRREILGIPNVPQKPMYALSFTTINYTKMMDILMHNNYMVCRNYDNKERGIIEVVIPYPVEEYINDLIDLIQIYKFEQRDISRKFYG